MARQNFLLPSVVCNSPVLPVGFMLVAGF
jgi:hypothetical protein